MDEVQQCMVLLAFPIDTGNLIIIFKLLTTKNIVLIIIV